MEKRSLKPPKRSIRRHHKERLKNKRQHYWFGKDHMNDRKLGIVTETPSPCSSYCCGNPRKWNGGELTIQEKKHLEEATDDWWENANCLFSDYDD